MPSVHAVASQPLAWVQPSLFRLEVELRAGPDRLGMLRWWERGWRAPATAELGEADWTFERQGIFRPRVVIGGGPDGVAFRLGWDRCGTLTFLDGRSLSWTFLDFAYRAQTWATPDGVRLLAFRGGSNRGTITIEQPARDRPDLPLLVALGSYLTLTGLGLASSGG